MRVCLIHWNAEEAKGQVGRLRAAGHRVVSPRIEPQALRFLRANPPDAVVIDLSRLPSHGRDVGLHLRQQKSTRRVPMLFVDGAPEKVAGVRALLPDAVFTTSRGVVGALKRAVSRAPADPVVPVSVLAGYSGTPLPKKLGIKPGATVALVGPPDGFAATLGPLPDGVTLLASSRGRPDLTVWFARSRSDLARGMRRIVAMAASGGVWIAWPKRTSPLAKDLDETGVRHAGLAAGLVDYKICAIDADWSGLKFAVRKPAR